MDITTKVIEDEPQITDDVLASTTQNERMMFVNALGAYAIALRDEAAMKAGLTMPQRCELYDMSIEAEALALRLQVGA